MNIFHRHNFSKIVGRSNVVQRDCMGYPLRLCIVKCKCGATNQVWLDTIDEDGDVELRWEAVGERIN